jgi:hypothetical protein
MGFMGTDANRADWRLVHQYGAGESKEGYRRALSRANARSMAASTARWTKNAVAMLPTNVAPTTIASIVLRLTSVPQ